MMHGLVSFPASECEYFIGEIDIITVDLPGIDSDNRTLWIRNVSRGFLDCVGRSLFF